MPWRLITVIVVFAVFLAFITFNLENRSDINFGFTKITGVPVFLTIFISFALGLFCTMPFVVRALKKRKEPLADDIQKKDDVPAVKRKIKLFGGGKNDKS